MTSSPDDGLAVAVRPSPAAPDLISEAIRPSTRLLTLDGMFSRVARRQPMKTAVRVAAGRLTYGGAEQRARQLASVLVLGGVQLGDPVIVHCEDHRQAAVAQLAVLKAGGVCVMVAGGTRSAALSRIADLSGAQVVLCSLATRALWRTGRQVVALDDPETWRRAGELPVDASLPRSSLMDAAYLLVTGAEGGGALGELADHRAWQLASAARLQRTGAGGQGLELRQADPATPAALAAMWWAFACGSSLSCRSGESPSVWAPTAVFTPEDYAARLVPGMAGPRTVVLIGGPCSRELVARHFEVLPGTRLWAEFAPAGGALPWTAQEWSPLPVSTGAVSVSAAPDDDVAGITVGSAASGVQMQILDADGTAVAPGRTGEVCAVGPALAFDRVRAPGGGPLAADPGPVLRSSWSGRLRADGEVEITGPLRPAC